LREHGKSLQFVIELKGARLNGVEELSVVFNPWAQFGGGHGERLPHFFRWGDIICDVPPTFSLQVLYLEKFQKQK